MHPQRDPEIRLHRRVYTALAFLVGVALVGATGYAQLGGGRWAWWDCLYMTLLTLSTVGFAETLPGLSKVQGARAWTMGLIVLGSGTALYFVSTLTALIVEGDLGGFLRRRRMARTLSALENHLVVCGVGSTGLRVVEELATVGERFVAIDRDEARITRTFSELGREFPYVVGDATEDTTLEQAGVARARGLITALHEDKDNLFVTISARAMSPKARIVAKAIEPGAEAKLRLAGANAVVSSNLIGGMRMASEMIRPSVVAFIDRMLRDPDEPLRIEEIELSGDILVGQTLEQSGLRERGALVIAARRPDGSYVYSPPGDYRLEAGTTLIVITAADRVAALRQHAGVLRIEP